LIDGNIGLTEDDFELRFMYAHDCSVVEPDHEFPRSLLACAERAGLDLKVDAMTASCDAWFYNNQLNIPTAVFGGGSLSVAHSNREKMELDQLAKAAEVVALAAAEFCR
jgi:acetylornithine deacetylase/succinyl-diaminopimelate desuccinylase